MAADVLHAYGVVAAHTDVRLPDRGLLDAPVERLPCGDFDALYSRHSEADLGQQVWDAAGQDPQWLGPIAQRHHEVLQDVTQEIDVLPLRLPSMYADEAALCGAVQQSRGVLRASLQVIGGHVEWGVKVFAGERPEAPPEVPRPTTGYDYLRMRAEQAARRDQARSGRQQHLTEVHESLAAAASHAVLSPVHDRVLSGHEQPMLLNASYLVPRDGRDRFLKTAEDVAHRFRSEGYSFEVTGPWPPYSFGHVTTPEQPT